MSETTHMICAHCGGDNQVSNAPYGSPHRLRLTFRASQGPILSFHCEHCRVEYPLPFTLADFTEPQPQISQIHPPGA